MRPTAPLHPPAPTTAARVIPVPPPAQSSPEQVSFDSPKETIPVAIREMGLYACDSSQMVMLDESRCTAEGLDGPAHYYVATTRGSPPSEAEKKRKRDLTSQKLKETFHYGGYARSSFDIIPPGTKIMIFSGSNEFSAYLISIFCSFFQNLFSFGKF